MCCLRGVNWKEAGLEAEPELEHRHSNLVYRYLKWHLYAHTMVSVIDLNVGLVMGQIIKPVSDPITENSWSY